MPRRKLPDNGYLRVRLSEWDRAALSALAAVIGEPIGKMMRRFILEGLSANLDLIGPLSTVVKE